MIKPNDFETRFLKHLCRIKEWNYHSKIEKEKDSEIKAFISFYVLQEPVHDFNYARLRYNRLNLLLNHKDFIPSFKAIFRLLETSANEPEFVLRYQKVTTCFTDGK